MIDILGLVHRDAAASYCMGEMRDGEMETGILAHAAREVGEVEVGHRVSSPLKKCTKCSSRLSFCHAKKGSSGRVERALVVHSVPMPVFGPSH